MTLRVTITVGRSIEELDVPDDLLTTATDADQDRASSRVGEAFTNAYRREHNARLLGGQPRTRFDNVDELRDQLEIGEMLVDARGTYFRVHSEANPREYRDEGMRGTYEFELFDTEIGCNPASPRDANQLLWPLRRIEVRVLPDDRA